MRKASADLIYFAGARATQERQPSWQGVDTHNVRAERGVWVSTLLSNLAEYSAHSLIGSRATFQAWVEMDGAA